MRHDHRFGIGAACLVLGGLCVLAATGGEAPGDRARAALDRGRIATGDARGAGRDGSTGLLAAKWAEAKVRPAPPADDAEFLRRVYLDLVGKIPTAAEAREFLDDPSPDKRARLVERCSRARRT